MRCSSLACKSNYLGAVLGHQMGDVVSNQARRLFLIRHGETTDNVAGLYGGIRDSPLTNHGFQQASRLGSWFAEKGVMFTHIFSSDLSRAFKTAEAIRIAQPKSLSRDASSRVIQVLALKELQEQNFGSFEGQPFHVRSSEKGKNMSLQPDFEDIESKDSLTQRANRFVMEYLMPALNDFGSTNTAPVIAVVSHGVTLSTLWRCILAHQPANTVKLDPEVSATLDPISLEYLGGWSNTGNLEAELHELQSAKSVDIIGEDTKNPERKATYVDPGDQPADAGIESSKAAPPRRSQFSLVIKAVNRREHLQGHKRTGGGVGSAKHDEGQKSIEKFFKRQKPS